MESLRRLPLGAVLLLIGVLLTGLAATSGLADLLDRWLTEESYEHGILIPLISFYLFLTKLPKLSQNPPRAPMLGVLSFAICITVLVLSEAAQIHTFSQYLLLALLASLSVACWGLQVVPVITPPLLLLLFAIPLPYFLQTMLTADLQLLSSELGVALIKLTDIPVFLEGNVIDLGVLKLQVVEACAGLNYLYPLLGIAFICTTFLRTPLWQRFCILLSVFPIAILFNGFRIAAVGLISEYFGTGVAEGFIHALEGWIVFAICLVALFFVMFVFSRFVNKRSLSADLDIQLSYPREGVQRLLNMRMGWSLLICLMMSIAGLAASTALVGREEVIPARPQFALFPTKLESWQGTKQILSNQQILTLNLSDYLLSQYRSPFEPQAVELYIAYYDSQARGSSAHSPKVCLPAGGWEISSFDTHLVNSDTNPVLLNRATIQNGVATKLVYYWFQQGGNTFANEFKVKVDIFRRSWIDNSTNGALVRVATTIGAGESEEQADLRLKRFMRQSHGDIDKFVPR